MGNNQTQPQKHETQKNTRPSSKALIEPKHVSSIPLKTRQLPNPSRVNCVPPCELVQDHICMHTQKCKYPSILYVNALHRMQLILSADAASICILLVVLVRARCSHIAIYGSSTHRSRQCSSKMHSSEPATNANIHNATTEDTSN